jgi:hypothetical protein
MVAANLCESHRLRSIRDMPLSHWRRNRIAVLRAPPAERRTRRGQPRCCAEAFENVVLRDREVIASRQVELLLHAARVQRHAVIVERLDGVGDGGGETVVGSTTPGTVAGKASAVCAASGSNGLRGLHSRENRGTGNLTARTPEKPQTLRIQTIPANH